MITPSVNFYDGLRSLAAGLGHLSRDKFAAAEYEPQPLTEKDLKDIYDESWLAEKVVEIPPEDMFRKWRDWDAKPDQVERIKETETELLVSLKLQNALSLARLYGGAGVLIVTQVADLSKPLNIEREDLQGLTVMNMRELTAKDLEKDPRSDNYAKPKEYQISIGEKSSGRTIHPSRLVRFVGKPHTDPFLATENMGWGVSVLRSVYDYVKAADATAMNVASLIFEANVDVLKIPRFMSQLADDRYKKLITERIALAMFIKGNNRTLLLDADETYERKQISFAGLPELMERAMINVSSGSKIPVTKFLGISPAGLSATGEHDMKNYYDMIESQQTLRITPACRLLDRMIVKRAINRNDEQIKYTWAPLEQTNEEERGKIGKAIAETIQILRNAGIYMDEELRDIATATFTAADVFQGLAQTIEKTSKRDLDEFFEPEPAPTMIPSQPQQQKKPGDNLPNS